MSVIEQMNRQETPGTVWDRNELNSVKGLHLRAFASGKKCFYFLYTTRFGIRRRPKIGEVPGTSLTEARERCRELQSQIAIGLDPKGNWDKKKKEKTVGEAFNEVLSSYWSSQRFMDSGRNTEVQNLFKNALETPFSKRKLSDVKTIEVRTWHTGLDKKPVLANRALEVLSKVYAYANEQEWTDKNPCVGVKAFTERKRKRVASKEELRNILAALLEMLKSADAREIQGALFLWALILSGARPISLKRAAWAGLAKFEEGHGVLSFYGKSTAESGELESVVFPKLLMQLIEKFADKNSAQIFKPARARIVWDKITTEFKCQDLWSRDLRRTFASIGLSQGISIDSIGEALNHKSAQTTKVYAKDFGGNNVKVTNEISNQVTEIGGISFNDIL